MCDCLYASEDIRYIIYPTTGEYFEYVGHQELTEEDRREARKMREDFERCFLPPGAKMTPLSEMKD